jgi:hypothetical protein
MPATQARSGSEAVKLLSRTLAAMGKSCPELVVTLNLRLLPTEIPSLAIKRTTRCRLICHPFAIKAI